MAGGSEPGRRAEVVERGWTSKSVTSSWATPARYRSTSALRAMPTKMGVVAVPAVVTRIVPRRFLWKSQPGVSELMSSPFEMNPCVGVRSFVVPDP